MREVFGALALGFGIMELTEAVEGEDTSCARDDSSAEDALRSPVDASGWLPAHIPAEIGTAASV